MSSYSVILTYRCHGSAEKKGEQLENNLNEEEKGKGREKGEGGQE